MNPQITFPNTRGKDTALYALDYQRALLSCLSNSIDGSTVDIEHWQHTLNLCSSLAHTAFNALKSGGEA
ncbi:hypothetical protein [Suttonella ornithocola]|uniref:Uncharacterized protein n=1 Tax=Suttonella ornithocola TaxID=279832 RepID=A0A380MK55_9GAMM|nr:hypothetical protein [Suttonella ornithocola]SUO93025.1 Uncharacterised protein [Suttonella ornithocola]